MLDWSDLFSALMGVCIGAGWVAARRRRPAPPARCTHRPYAYRCDANSSPVCSDGRCRLHCRQNCNCEKENL